MVCRKWREILGAWWSRMADIDDPEPTPRARSTYSSKTIRERRSRILAETRKLIAEEGPTGFSMEELCKRAGVAKRTLYNAFGSKEHMVAVSIQEYFEDFAQHIRFTRPPGTLQHMIEHIGAVARRNMQLLNYNRALMAIYHSPEVDPDIWATIRRIAANAHRPYVEIVAAKRQLQPWMNTEEVTAELTRYRYALANDACNGRVPVEDYPTTLLIGMLNILAGATRGGARRDVEDALRQIAGTGPEAAAT